MPEDEHDTLDLAVAEAKRTKSQMSSASFSGCVSDDDSDELLLFAFIQYAVSYRSLGVVRIRSFTHQNWT